ncbi:MAG: hypothetical protein ACOZQL_35080 [Myxococcota bacterium]
MSDSALDALAARLVLPAKSGIYLTKNELIALARLSEGSLRVNERRRMLADVLKSPQSPAELSQLLARLVAFCQAHLAAWDDLLEAYPHAARFAEPWQQKTRATIASLEGIQEELAATPVTPT